MTKTLTFLFLLALTNISLGFLFLEDKDNPSSLLLKILGIPFINCNSGPKCFYKFISARPNVRLRIITMPIIDQLMGKKYRVEQVKNEEHDLNEQLLDEAHERKMKEMAANIEEQQARLALEEVEHWKKLNQVVNYDEIN